MAARQKKLEPGEFEQLTLPLRRLKVSLVWQTALRDKQVAESIRVTAVQQGLPVPTMAEAILSTPEAGSRIVHRGLSFELGSLDETYPFTDRRRGQASIHFGHCWRVESPQAVVFGSRDDRTEIDQEIQSFEGRRVLSLQVIGRLPEIAISLSKRRWIHSFDTSWSIGLPDRTCICSRSGDLIRYSEI